MEHLPIKSPVIQQLGSKPRYDNAVDVSGKLTQLFVEETPKAWEKFLNEYDYPKDFDLTFTAIVATFALLMLPSWCASPILVYFIDLLEKKHHDFVVGEYIPMMVEATRDVKISAYDWIILARLFVGVIIKIVYAFLYQEQRISPDFILEPAWVNFGGHMIWAVNMLADLISNQPQTDLGV